TRHLLSSVSSHVRNNIIDECVIECKPDDHGFSSLTRTHHRNTSEAVCGCLHYPNFTEPLQRFAHRRSRNTKSVGELRVVDVLARLHAPVVNCIENLLENAGDNLA